MQDTEENDCANILVEIKSSAFGEIKIMMIHILKFSYKRVIRTPSNSSFVM